MCLLLVLNLCFCLWVEKLSYKARDNAQSGVHYQELMDADGGGLCLGASLFTPWSHYMRPSTDS